MRIEEVAAKALENVGGDRYRLALMVAKRVEELSAGKEVLVKGLDKNKMKFSDIALAEIAQGKVTFDGIAKTDQ